MVVAINFSSWLLRFRQLSKIIFASATTLSERVYVCVIGSHLQSRQSQERERGGESEAGREVREG